MSRVTVTLADPLWLWPDDDGRWYLGRAPDEWPGARIPRPQVLAAGAVVDLEIWRLDCPGCTLMRRMMHGEMGQQVEATVEHSHGRP